MDFNAIIQRILNLVTKTDQEWDKIKGETSSIADLYLKFALIVFAVPSVAILVGTTINGSFKIGLGLAIFLYIFTLGIVFLVGVLIDVLGPQFGATKDMISSQKLAVYSLSPYGILGALLILPVNGQALFYFVMLLSLYGFYLMYIGAPKLLNAAQDKLIPLVAIMGVLWLLLLYFDFRISFRMTIEMFIGSYRF